MFQKDEKGEFSVQFYDYGNVETCTHEKLRSIYKYIDKAPCKIYYIYYIVVGIGLANSSRFSWEKRNIIILSMYIYYMHVGRLSHRCVFAL